MIEGAEGGKDPPAERLVAVAIQDLAAARLGRGFLPLGILFLLGLGLTALPSTRGIDGLVLALGSPLAAGAMLARGLRAVHRAFGRPRRPWMDLASPAGVLPPLLGLWVLGWLGLRSVATWGGPGPVVSGLAWIALGAWVVRAWLRVEEVGRLARVMVPDAAATPGRRI